MRSTGLAAALALLAGGCLPQGGDATPAKVEQAIPAAAPLAKPYGWRILRPIRFAVFSATDLRDHDLTVTCQSPDRLAFYYDLPPQAPRQGRLRLTSGDLSAEFAGEVGERRATPPPTGRPPDGEGPLLGIQISSYVPIDHPVLARFFADGRLSADWGGHALNLDASAEDRRDLEALWRSCP